MKKYELSAFVNFDNCFESQFPVGGEVGALNRVYGYLKGMCASGDDVGGKRGCERAEKGGVWFGEKSWE